MTWIRHFLAHWRRLVVLLLMMGLGFGLYEWLPPTERWRTPVDSEGEAMIAISPDGRFGLSSSMDRAKDRLRKWDLVSGTVIAEFGRAAGGYECQSRHLSRAPWQRYWAGLPIQPPDVLELYDVETGAERRLTIEPIAAKQNERKRAVVVSPPGDVAAVYHYHEKHHFNAWHSWTQVLKIEIHLYALPGGEKLATFVTTEDTGPFTFAGGFFPKGSVFAFPTKTDEGQPIVRLWDVAKRRLAGSVAGESGVALQDAGTGRTSPPQWWLQPSADDRYLQTTDPAGKAKLWHLADLDRPVLVENVSAGPIRRQLSPDSRAMVELVDEEVVIRALPTGTETGRATLPNVGFNVAFSADSKLVAISSGMLAPEPKVSLIHVETSKILWTASTKRDLLCLATALFDAEGKSVCLTTVVKESYCAEIRDVGTGRLLASCNHTDGIEPLPCENGRRAVIRTVHPAGWFRTKLEKWLPFKRDEDTPVAVRVIDLQTGQVVFYLNGRSGLGDCLLSPDGCILIAHHSQSIRCYDVPARHPWSAIVGIPASIGAFLLLIGLAWKRWRGRKSPAVTVPPCPPDS